MKKATISYTKDNLSRLLAQVREGETVLVLDRDTPVARIEPVDLGRRPDHHEALLVRNGVVRPRARRLDVAAFLKRPKAVLRQGGSAVGALLCERETGR